MNEQEVELVDYIRIFWWGKWIALACFVLAVGTAAIIIWTSAPRYTITGSYSVQETLSLYVPCHEALSRDASSSDRATLTSGAVQVLPDLNAPGLQRSVNLKDLNLIDVTITGTMSPLAVQTALASSKAALEAGLVAQVEQALAHERARAKVDCEQITGQVAMLRAQMTGETREVVLEAYAENVAALEARLAEVSVRRDGLSALVSSDLVSLREIHRGPVVEEARNAKTTLAVAGFLGLLLGMLVTFFAHYLVSVARTVRATSGGK